MALKNIFPMIDVAVHDEEIAILKRDHPSFDIHEEGTEEEMIIHHLTEVDQVKTLANKFQNVVLDLINADYTIEMASTVIYCRKKGIYFTDDSRNEIIYLSPEDASTGAVRAIYTRQYGSRLFEELDAFVIEAFELKENHPATYIAAQTQFDEIYKAYYGYKTGEISKKDATSIFATIYLAVSTFRKPGFEGKLGKYGAALNKYCNLFFLDLNRLEELAFAQKEETKETPDVSDTEEEAKKPDAFDFLKGVKDELSLLYEGFNGPALYETSRDAFGEIEIDERVVVPKGFEFGYDYLAKRFNASALNGVSFSTDSYAWPKPNSKDPSNATILLLKLAAMNLSAFGNSEDKYELAVLRAILLVRGLLFKMPAQAKSISFKRDNRCVYVDEVKYFDGLEKDLPVRDVYNRLKTPNDAMRVVKQHWVSLCSMLVVCFGTRGHHFVGSETTSLLAETADKRQGKYNYTDLYKKMFIASFQDISFPFKSVKTLFRTALHPFGLNSFTILTKQYAQESKLPTAMLKRIALSPAGAALVTTSSAIIKLIYTSTLIPVLPDHIRENWNLVVKVSNDIKSNWESYHINSPLFAGRNLTDQERRDLELAQDYCRGYAPVFCAFVDQECPGAAIAAQRCLAKYKEEQISVYNRICKLISLVTKIDENAKPEDLEKKFTKVLTSYEIKEPSVKAITTNE